MHSFVEMADAVGATSKKLVKLRLITEFFKSLRTADSALAARFLSAHPFAGHDERTLGVGGASLSRIIAEAAGKAGEHLGVAYRAHGDLGEMAEELLLHKSRDGDLPLAEVSRLFEELAAARSQAQKADLLANAFARASPGDVKYIVKIVTGDLRIGSKESLVEEAIAKAFERPLSAKANITDITNMAAPVAVDSGTILQLVFTSSIGAPQQTGYVAQTGSVAVQRKAGGLWFSSSWDGTKTVQKVLASGVVAIQ